MALQVLVTTPEGKVYQGEALKVVVPAADGELGVLPRHAPLIAQLGVGELRVTPVSGPGSPPGGGAVSFVVAGGFLHVLRDKVTVLASRAEPASAIDRARVEEELRLLQAEHLPPGAGAEPRRARLEKIGLARARLKAARRKAAG